MRLNLAVKIGLAGIAAVLWSLGLVDQLGDVVQTSKYVGISLLMVATAALA